MEVFTISRNQLNELSNKLLTLIKKDHLNIDIIIGIATGGIYVSSPIKKQLEKEHWDGKYYEIKLSRPSTKSKEKLQLNMFLKKLPYFMSNLLRKLEVIIFENFKSKIYAKTKENNVVLSSALVENIKNANSLLLIDDAIDTGSTVLAIKNVIEGINPKINIKIAVLTVTHKNPHIQPDYTLYRRVLLRCPWAMDYKGKDKIE